MDLSAAQAVYELRDVIRVYREADVETIALRGIELTVMPGEFVVVMGRSGSGKSTLLNLLSGTDRPTAGRISYRGLDLGRAEDERRATIRGREIGIVFQSQNLFGMLSMLENVMLAARLAGRSVSSAEAQQRLEAIGLGNRSRHRPSALSGGEQQRAAVACVLAAEPKVLLADEITGELDSISSAEVLRLVDETHRRDGTTVVLVTHDSAIAAHADRVVELRDGRVVGGMALPV